MATNKVIAWLRTWARVVGTPPRDRGAYAVRVTAKGKERAVPLHYVVPARWHALAARLVSAVLMAISVLITTAFFWVGIPTHTAETQGFLGALFVTWFLTILAATLAGIMAPSTSLPFSSDLDRW